MYSENLGDQDKQFLAKRINIVEQYLDLAKEKLGLYKTLDLDDFAEVEGIVSLEEILGECEKAVDCLSETINLREESGLIIKSITELTSTAAKIIDLCKNNCFDRVRVIRELIIKIQDELSGLKLFIEWKEQTKMLIEDSLVKCCNLMKQHNLSFEDVKIMVSYVDGDYKTRQNIWMLELIFKNLGIVINCFKYTDPAALQQQLSNHTHAIILATPAYQMAAAPDDKASKLIKEILDKFGTEKEGNQAKLHVLLCDGSNNLVTNQIVDRKYLVRPYQAVFNEEKIWYQLDHSSFETIAQEEVEEQKIYITKESDCSLRYRVKNLLNPDKPIEEGVIEAREIFGERHEPGELLEAIREWDVEKINQLLPDLLEITASRGLTLKESIANFQEQLPLLDFIEHFLNPLSYEYESGMLPSILDITSQAKQKIYKIYKDWFNVLKQEQHELNIKYRLKKTLLRSIEKDEDALAAIELDKSQQEYLEKNINKIIELLKSSSNLKSSLVLCQNGLDQILINMLLKRQLIQEENTIIISIDCGRKYKDGNTPACEVEEFLREKLYLNVHEVEALAKQGKEQVIILFENYEKLKTYENLYVKNKLSKWRKVKMLVTCDREFFQHRDYASCILPDPGFMDLNVINRQEIDSILSLPGGRVRRSSIVDPSKMVGYSFAEAWRNETKFARAKRYAQQLELHKFLRNINNAFKEKVKGIREGEQIFISYAWEKDRDKMIRKQNLLAKIAADLQILGFFVWLDIERLASNIDRQLENNIAKSRYAFIIGTPSYTEKANDNKTYVHKEFEQIMRSKGIKVVQINFEEEKEGRKSFPDQLEAPKYKGNRVDFCGINDEEEYIKQLTAPLGLIAKLLDLDLDPALKIEYEQYYAQLEQQLQLLPASHMLVDKGQEDVQAYDIDGRLEVYIEPFGQDIDPNKEVADVSKVPLGKDFSDFLENNQCNTYVALGEAGSGKTLFTLWTFKQYVLQPWHNYRNKELKVYLCDQQPKDTEIEVNAIYLFLSKPDFAAKQYVQYACIVKSRKQDREMQIITVHESNLAIYKQIKEALAIGTKGKITALDEIPDFINYDENKLFDMLKPQWLPIYIPLKNYAYPGKDRAKDSAVAPLKYIEDILLADYYVSAKDVLELKRGLGFKQNVLFILDGYDELVKGNNPNFTQALLSGYKGLYLSRKKPSEVEEDFIYIYADDKDELHFLFKTEDEGKIKIVDKLIYKYNEELIRTIKLEIEKLSDIDLTNNAELIDQFFAYTLKNHFYDSYEIDCISKLSGNKAPEENVLYLEQAGNGKLRYVFLSGKGENIEGTMDCKEKLADILNSAVTSEIIEKKQQILKTFLEKHSQISTNFKAHSLRWQYAKIFITGRPEHFDNDIEHVTAFSLNGSAASYRVNYMAKFTAKEIEKYITDYQKADPEQARQLGELVKKQNMTDITKAIIEKINNLGKEVSELITNPFLLNITLQALPDLNSEQASGNLVISRANLYEGFIKYWYTKEIARKGKSILECSQVVCHKFAQELVMQMFIHNTISISEKSSELWKFFNNLENTFARETCPLRRSGNEYSFIHKSVYEYLLARYLMTSNWLEIQNLTSRTQLSINGLEQTYNNSLARLLATEPSVFSFIQDFARPHVNDKPSLKIPNSHQAENQPQNLYNIFLELLRWNENKLALTLITAAKNQEEEALDEAIEELAEMFKKLLLTEDAPQQAALTIPYHAWSPPTPTPPENAPIFISWHRTRASRIPLNTLTVRFLNLIGWGEQQQAGELLSAHSELTVQRGHLTDCSGRTWENITALQYALLALDYHMWTMLYKHMEANNQIKDAREQIATLQQVATLNSERGWEIIGSEVNWPALVWQPLIKALDEYIQNYNAWDDTQCTNHWCQQVGGAQLILPAHVINEYSHPERSNGFAMCKAGFWNGQDKDANLPRTGVADWINNSGYKLGSQFAWLRAEWTSASAGSYRWKPGYVKIDLAAVTELLRSRTEQAQTLVLQLTQNVSPRSRLAIR